ncbi:MAG: hypothetical protein EOO60_05320 [Hymenobacter sp.]|nr:MAG: hypothetical protein EOO60_05320 [Hymenobacter sp.]
MSPLQPRARPRPGLPTTSFIRTLHKTSATSPYRPNLHLIGTWLPPKAEAQAEHTYHSKNKHSEGSLAKFNTGEIQRLACVAQLLEGISIPNLRVGIIWHAFGNERKAAQRIGRLLRLNPDQTATVAAL